MKDKLAVELYTRVPRYCRNKLSSKNLIGDLNTVPVLSAINFIRFSTRLHRIHGETRRAMNSEQLPVIFGDPNLDDLFFAQQIPLFVTRRFCREHG